MHTHIHYEIHHSSLSLAEPVGRGTSRLMLSASCCWVVSGLIRSGLIGTCHFSGSGHDALEAWGFGFVGMLEMKSWASDSLGAREVGNGI